jgi:hypothetical protein
MDGPEAPAAPDPAQTAAAQAKANKESAVAQYGLNATNQVTPQGNLTYKQIGQWEDGTPRFEATQSYSPGEQGIYESGVATRQNLGNIGSTQSAKIGEHLNTPFDLNAARDSRITDIQKSFLDPQWQEQEARMNTQLINSGVRPGTEAYTRQMRDFSTNRQRAYDQAYLDSYGKAEQSALTQRNQPINEISALLSGSQVSNPAFANTPTPGVAPTDYIGAVGQSLAQQNVGFNAANQQHMGMMNGLFGLGKTALGSATYGPGGWGLGGS